MSLNTGSRREWKLGNSESNQALGHHTDPYHPWVPLEDRHKSNTVNAEREYNPTNDRRGSIEHPEDLVGTNKILVTDRITVSEVC